MDDEQAQEDLSSEDAHTRLRAARVLATVANRKHLPALQRALASEDVAYTREALTRAVELARADAAMAAPVEEERLTLAGPPGDDLQGIEAEIVERTTAAMVHEIEPIVGALRVFGQAELEDGPNTRTWRQIERLERLVASIEIINRASAVPQLRECRLDEVVSHVAEGVEAGTGHPVSAVGPSERMVVTDRGLVEVIIGNALANAVEASRDVGATEAVTVSWGTTERECWVRVLDNGPGVSAPFDELAQFGRSTREKHLGAGLSAARRAAESLGGTVDLVNREGSGARFTFQWPCAEAHQ